MSAAYGRLCAEAYAAAPDLAIGPVLRLIARDVEGAPVLAIPGTRPNHIADDLADLNVGPLDVGPGAAHRGFWQAAQMALPFAVRRDLLVGRLDLAGHSLGAAIAVNLATMLTMAAHPPRRVVGFGCPHTALGRWQRDLLAAAGVEVRLYRNGADPVPLVPVHADLCPDLDRLLRWCLPAVGDWHWAGEVVQLAPSGAPDIEAHAIARYCAALDVLPVTA